MPLALVLAFAGSVVLHVAALFGADIELPFNAGSPPALNAELRPPPPAPPPPPSPPVIKPSPPVHKKVAQPALPVTAPQAVPTDETLPTPPTQTAADAGTTNAPETAPPPPPPPPSPPTPILPGKGTLHFIIYKGTLGFEIGRAEHHWAFSDDGQYVLTAVNETSGLVSLLKPLRVELESRGHLLAGGLQPDSYRKVQPGKNESANFDWADGKLRLEHNNRVFDLAPGAQDIFSLSYQLAYLPTLATQSRVGVMTGRTYENYTLEALGEEMIDTPAGPFRTLHLRARAATTTEIWIALDVFRLPVKIRYTEKNGDSFEQAVSQIEVPPKPAPASN